MGQFSYEEQGTNTWLVYKIEEEEEMDHLSLGMLTKNKIPGIMPIVYTPLNDTGYVKYNVSSMINGNDHLAGVVNRKRLLGVFRGIINAMTSAESYMLDLNSLILDLNYIFVNVSTGEAQMVCVPVLLKEQKHMDLAGFFRNFLFSVQFDSSENFDYVTKMVNYLNSTPLFSLAEFKKLVDQLYHEKGMESSGGSAFGGYGAKSNTIYVENRVDTVRQEKPVQEGLKSKENVHVEETVRSAVQNPEEDTGGDIGFAIPEGSDKAETPTGKKSHGLFGLKFKRTSSEDTKGTKKKAAKEKPLKGKTEKEKPGKKKKEIPVVKEQLYEVPMTEDQVRVGEYGATDDDFEMPGTVSLTLRYITEGRTIPISSFPFEIGREGSGLKIDASKTKISRRHAVITKAGGQFLITDFSRHGTFLDGQRIPQGEQRLLTNGMRILLKTEEFEVRITG